MPDMEQKIIFFSEHKSDLTKINSALKKRWAIVKLLPNRGSFIGLLEKTTSAAKNSVYIPPRKKIIIR